MLAYLFLYLFAGFKNCWKENSSSGWTSCRQEKKKRVSNPAQNLDDNINENNKIIITDIIIITDFCLNVIYQRLSVQLIRK